MTCPQLRNTRSPNALLYSSSIHIPPQLAQPAQLQWPFQYKCKSNYWQQNSEVCSLEDIELQVANQEAKKKKKQELWEKQPLYRVKEKMKHHMMLKIHTSFIIHPWKAQHDHKITGALRNIRTHLPLLTLEQWDCQSVGSEPHRTYDHGPSSQKTGFNSAQCASYKGCPKFKVWDNKSTKELRNTQDCQKHRSETFSLPQPGI